MAQLINGTNGKATRAGGKGRHKFTVNYAARTAFARDGLRPFFVYRDLGIKAATGGRMGAQVIRAARACSTGTGRHKHRLAYQLVYILKGWTKFWYEGHGTVTLGPGDSVYQPPEIVHELVECSKDLELIEITLPAEFATIAVAKRSAGPKVRTGSRTTRAERRPAAGAR